MILTSVGPESKQLSTCRSYQVYFCYNAIISQWLIRQEGIATKCKQSSLREFYMNCDRHKFINSNFQSSLLSVLEASISGLGAPEPLVYITHQIKRISFGKTGQQNLTKHLRPLFKRVLEHSPPFLLTYVSFAHTEQNN